MFWHRAIPAFGLFILAASVNAGWAQSFGEVPIPQLRPEISLPGLQQYAPPMGDDTVFDAGEFLLEARLTRDGEPLSSGVLWRIFSPRPGADGRLPLVATAKGGSAKLKLPPGNYLAHAAFGKAGAMKEFTVGRRNGVQTIVLNAGGLMMSAVAGPEKPIPASKLAFDIYAKEKDKNGERLLVMGDVPPNTIVRLSAGTYHVISRYGEVNSTVGADLIVEAGKVTEAALAHRAADLTLKLVSEPGGEAIADTGWSVIGASGDIVMESVGAFSRMVLAEGEYTAVARHQDHVYERNFQVSAGVDTDVEVLAKP